MESPEESEQARPPLRVRQRRSRPPQKSRSVTAETPAASPESAYAGPAVLASPPAAQGANAEADGVSEHCAAHDTAAKDVLPPTSRAEATEENEQASQSISPQKKQLATAEPPLDNAETASAEPVLLASHAAVHGAVADACPAAENSSPKVAAEDLTAEEAQAMMPPGWRIVERTPTRWMSCQPKTGTQRSR